MSVPLATTGLHQIAVLNTNDFEEFLTAPTRHPQLHVFIHVGRTFFELTNINNNESKNPLDEHALNTVEAWFRSRYAKDYDVLPASATENRSCWSG